MGHEVLANANPFACQTVEQFDGALDFIIKSNKQNKELSLPCTLTIISIY